MIDIFNNIFNDITIALQTFNVKIKTSATYNNIPSSFPFVSIEEISNTTNENYETSCSLEEFANISYELNIYTKGEKTFAKARAIVNVIDNEMQKKGFVRRSYTPMQNDDETIYRIVLRYGGVVSKDKTQVYRR